MFQATTFCSGSTASSLAMTSSGGVPTFSPKVNVHNGWQNWRFQWFWARHRTQGFQSSPLRLAFLFHLLNKLRCWDVLTSFHFFSHLKHILPNNTFETTMKQLTFAELSKDFRISLSWWDCLKTCSAIYSANICEYVICVNIVNICCVRLQELLLFTLFFFLLLLQSLFQVLHPVSARTKER